MFHQTLIRTARGGKTSYRIRHRKPLTIRSTPLVIGGYGVELALKRTDYIVIDDRKEDEAFQFLNYVH
jgi:UDP-glucose:glycoprotein glucosyltransferase